MTYHPGDGQMFFPLDKIVAFCRDGAKGLYIHSNIWHEGILPAEDNQRFRDRQ
ncbi:hypothetical protein [Leisingera sp.]|uniref:hypothetical protein n=1 Tax=Leisingera sp. TaxID=1879318 RepID=UPI002B26B330|nr:hypothetical protein [Leisingera sp.]